MESQDQIVQPDIYQEDETIKRYLEATDGCRVAIQRVLKVAARGCLRYLPIRAKTASFDASDVTLCFL